ncbi:MAG TPA: transporter substrate-binding domain-containing protein [Azonexus sp.]|nr:transporter substrate-binding domain-containing protein [Azonexus sp.]
MPGVDVVFACGPLAAFRTKHGVSRIGTSLFLANRQQTGDTVKHPDQQFPNIAASTSNERRHFLKILAALPLAMQLPAVAGEQLNAVTQRGQLRIAVYNNFPPYSDAGQGVDVDLGKAIAGKLGLKPEIIGFRAGEDMGDDLRNMVWKGHYLRGEPADVMMHVPLDKILADANNKVRIFGQYHQESLAMARDPFRVPAPPHGSAAVALEVFTREKIGVEGATLADAFLLSTLSGRLRENVVHFHSVAEAAKALREGRVAAVLAPRGELEAALPGEKRLVIDEARIAQLTTGRWPLGMAVKADAGDLAAAIDRALAELKADGTVAAIFKRHGITLHGA